MNGPDIMQEYLRPTRFIDSQHPDIVEQTKRITSKGQNEAERAIALYYWVRDHIRYNPYAVSGDAEAFRASATLQAGEGWCVPKALLLAALCRAAHIPARVGFADVRNHLSTERMRQAMKTDIFYFHGYTSVYLHQKWVKATPAFNIELCQKFGLAPLEFNGLDDSLYHEYDLAGNKHMEYLNDRGEYIDLPFDEMVAVFEKYYPGMLAQSQPGELASKAEEWDADVAAESQQRC